MKITIPNIKRRSEVDSTIQSQSSGQKYSDLETAFMDKNSAGDITINVGSVAILSAVKNILITSFKEIPYMPRAGANITSLLFSNSIEDIASYSGSIQKQIENNDNRVTVRDIKVVASPSDHSVSISVIVDVKGDDRYKGLSLKHVVKRMTTE